MLTTHIHTLSPHGQRQIYSDEVHDQTCSSHEWKAHNSACTNTGDDVREQGMPTLRGTVPRV